MTYAQVIEQTPVVLVEFFASWCPHCQKMMPIVAQVKEELEGSAAVAQFDIDQNKTLASENGVQGVPTFIIYKNGREMWRESGEIEGQSLLEKVRSFE